MVTLKFAVFWNLMPHITAPAFQKDPAPHDRISRCLWNVGTILLLPHTSC